MTRKQSEAEKTLRRARKLISKPEKWNKHEYAITPNGGSLGIDGIRMSNSDQIASYCSLGAIYKANGPGEHKAQYLLCKAVMAATDHVFVDVAEYNDSSEVGHEDVLKLFDEAIKLARKEDDR